MSTETRPNLFIVGAQKSGTSALAGWLGQHPQVCMSFPKEPGFLAFGEAGYVFPDGYGKPAPASRYVVRDEQSYLRLFSGTTGRERIFGEASTWYLTQPGMPETLHRFNPGAQIIVLLRNPVERAYSAWCHARADDLEPCAEFADALAMEADRGEVEFLLRYRQMGLYSAALRAYQAVFPPAQMKILFYDDLRSDPAALWRDVCSFLQIDESHLPQFEQRYNTSGEPRSRALQTLLRSHRVKSVARRALPYPWMLALKGRLDTLNLQALPPVQGATRIALLDFYRDDISAVAHLTGRNLREWLQ
tara:strand:- start:9332 stop:10243 length:912 start_codon:yes stop_codon:yes gene_type:complete